MIKKALRNAAGIGLGSAIGFSVLPRLIYPELYNETYPPVWQHAIFAFVVTYITGFIVFLTIEGIKNQLK